MITNRAGLDAGTIEALADQVGHGTLERVVRWAIGTGRDIRNIVKQDEFTQDVVVTYEGSLFLVYDST